MKPARASAWAFNFPTTLSPSYRRHLIEPVLRWTRWAYALHAEGRLTEIPGHVEVEMGSFRIGDIAIVGMPVEPFLGIGRQIRAGSPLPLTIPCGYMNDNIAYVQDSPNIGDRDYSSSYYRYTSSFPPFRKPAGDLLAQTGIAHVKSMMKVAV